MKRSDDRRQPTDDANQYADVVRHEVECRRKLVGQHLQEVCDRRQQLGPKLNSQGLQGGPEVVERAVEARVLSGGQLSGCSLPANSIGHLVEAGRALISQDGGHTHGVGTEDRCEGVVALFLGEPA